MSDDGEWIGGTWLGSWMLPHGHNTCDVYYDPIRGLELEWDVPPPAWPRADIDHWADVVVPAILAALATIRTPSRVELDT